MLSNIKENTLTLLPFQQIVEALPMPVFVKNQQHRWVYVNQAFCDLVGFSKKDLLGKLEDNIKLTDRSYQVFQQERLLFKFQKPTSYSTIWTNRKGESYEVIVKNSVIKDDYGLPLLMGAVGTFKRQENNKLLLNHLKAKYQKFKNIFDTLPFLVAIINKNGVYEYVNQAMAELFDRPPYEFIGKREEELSGVNFKFSAFLQNEDLKAGRSIFNQKNILQKKQSQEIVWLETTIIPLKKHFTISGQKIESFFIISSDITANVHTEKAYRERDRLFHLVLDNIPQYAFWKDKNSRYIYCNQNFATITGFKKPFDLVGLTDYDLPWQKHEADFYRQKDMEIMETGLPQYNIESKQIKKDGRITWVSSNKVPLKNEAGEVIGVLGTFEDITKRKKQAAIIQKQVKILNEKNNELETYIDSNMQLENFAYIASHDLKAPIRTVISFSQLLKRALKNNKNSAVHEYLHYIVSASHNMKQLIDDLLAFSLVKNQKYEFKPIHIKILLQEILYSLHVNIKEKQACVKLGKLPTIIRGDKTKLLQLFQNLIANAIKFHKPNEKPIIKICGVEKENCWQFTVQDNGIGISPEFHEKVFLLFKKLHSSSKYEGTGIGLALCKTVVEQHGGKIWLASSPAGGTTFCFTIMKDLI